MTIRFVAGEWANLDGLAEDVIQGARPRIMHVMKQALLYFEGQLKVTLSGQRHGRVYTVPKTHVKYTASAPGEPPAVMLSNLKNSVGHSGPTWDSYSVGGEVGVGLGTKPGGGEVDPEKTYARRLELGGIDSRGIYIAPRPYMAPTAERVELVLSDLFERGI